MRPVRRALEPVLAEAARSFPSVVITGPRRAGKTTLLRRRFPKAAYILLEDPDIQARARSDPRALLDSITPPAVFDEIQNVPELLPYIRSRIDREPRKMGQWFFTGSQEAPLMQGVTESMAGRAAILQLLPLSLAETPLATVLHGGYPEVLDKPRSRALWFSSYVQTYLERDVRTIVNIRDLSVFRRFLAVLASRHGQVLNRSDIAASLGVTVPTIGHWLDVLEITGQITIVQPYFENFGKRLLKTPKVYLGDSGMACYLLGITSQAELDRSPFLGSIFEGFVAAEILKSQINQGRRKELYYFRDQQGLEVDFLFLDRQGQLWMVECKAAKTVFPSMARPLASLRRSIEGQASQGRQSVQIASARQIVVHRASTGAPRNLGLAPGVEALDLTAFVKTLGSSGRPTRDGARSTS